MNVPNLDEVRSRISKLLEEFPGASINVDVSWCDCAVCQKNAVNKTVNISLSGSRADGRVLEPAFQHMSIFAEDWDKWDARADLIKRWLTKKVGTSIPASLRKRLGPRQSAHILLVEMLQPS